MLTKRDMHLILGVVIPNMEDGFEIKTRGGEVLKVDPEWECCQQFAEGLKKEMAKRLNKIPYHFCGFD